MSRVEIRNRIQGTLAASAMLAASLSPTPAMATDVTGTVTFSGNVVFATPIVGIALSDLTASSGPGIEATGNGEQCAIVTNGSAPVGAGGAYPDSGSLSVEITIGRGGMNPPDGTCLVQLRAAGNDGGSISARGTVTVEVSVAEISGNAAIVVPEDIVVRQSKTVAGISKDCQKWVKKEIKFKGKCNYFLWKLGPVDGALKCKNAGIEPPDCDLPGYVDETVELSFGQMDQQVDPPTAEQIDLDVLNPQSKCQRFLGKAAVNFFARRNQLVQKLCVDAVNDTDACRSQASQDSAAKLSVIDNCANVAGDTQATDVGSGLTLPDVAEPCLTQCVDLGVLDRKCLKDCFELELSTFSDGLIGDVPECGNGVEQAGEACDDGNVMAGDCCSAICTAEPAGSQSCGIGACEVTVDQCNAGEPVVCTPGAPGVESGNCGDLIDNDCDGLVDLADVLDCP